MGIRNLVILLASAGIIIPIIYCLIVRDPNLLTSIVASTSVFLVGLVLVYLVVEKRINEEKKTRLRQVENSVLVDVYVYAVAIVRFIGIYGGQHELEVKPREDSIEMGERTKTFAKNVRKDGFHLPQSSLNKESADEFIRSLDGLLKELYSVQAYNTFVFQEYPAVANILSALRAKESDVKSYYLWVFYDKQTSAKEFQQDLEKGLAEMIVLCDELVEITSSHQENTPK